MERQAGCFTLCLAKLCACQVASWAADELKQLIERHSQCANLVRSLILGAGTTIGWVGIPRVAGGNGRAQLEDRSQNTALAQRAASVSS